MEVSFHSGKELGLIDFFSFKIIVVRLNNSECNANHDYMSSLRDLIKAGATSNYYRYLIPKGIVP